MTARFIYDNLVADESMISVSSLRNGLVTSAKKEGTGSAVITTSGNFTGSVDLEYIVEIDSIAGGAEVGQATFKWSDGGGGWDATGVITPAAPTELNNGTKIAFTGGAGADFVVGDKWYFKGINLFNAGKMIDRDRDSSYRSTDLEAPNTITITFIVEQKVDVLIIYDHNFTDAPATIVLWGDDAATFDSDAGSAQVIENVTWTIDKIIHYLVTVDRTKKYWQIRITDAANPDEYIDIGEIFLGSYMELSKTYSLGFSKGFALLYDSNRTPYGVTKKRFYNRQRSFTYNFNLLIMADIVLLEAMIDSIASRATGQFLPFWFNDDSGIPAQTWMVDISAIPENHRVLEYYRTSLELLEVMRSI